MKKRGLNRKKPGGLPDVLMQADLFGIESHGAQRMMYYHQNIKSGSVDVRGAGGDCARNAVSARWTAISRWDI